MIMATFDPKPIIGKGPVRTFKSKPPKFHNITKVEAFMDVPGYEKLAVVLQKAYNQAAVGKGKERHAQDNEPFHDQVMADGAKRFGVGALLFQAYKKSEESQRLNTERGINELLGAIVYLAGAVIERQRLADKNGEDKVI
jgi:hypothetical protein